MQMQNYAAKVFRLSQTLKQTPMCILATTALPIYKTEERWMFKALL